MRRFACVWLLAVFSLLTQTSFAQEKNITGTVTSDDGNPLPGVTVTNKTTKKKTTTNEAGVFSIKANNGNTISFSYVGYAQQDVVVGAATNLNIRLATDPNATLTEVIVNTSMGIKKSKRELGYSVTEVKGSEVAQTQRDNMLMALAGRVPGANITATSGMPGSSVAIQLRGVTSLTSNNSPLFVIDGVPVDNKTMHSNNLVTLTENRTIDFSNRISDLNPDDIESITVLKGPEASALYGLDAGNGVIMITTKKGRQGSGRVSYSANFTLEKVQRLPEMQQVYNQGSNGILNENVLTYFGPKYPAGTTYFDNINNFFETGKAQRHNISVDGGTQNTTYRFSAAYSTREGVIPTTKYDRFNLGLAGTQKIGNYLTLETNLSYINSKNRKVSKGNNSFLLGLMQWPADVDVTDYLTAGGTRKKFTTLGTEIENPFFDVNKNKLGDETNRFIGNFNLNAVVTSWLSLTGRMGWDAYTTNMSVLYHPESNRGISLNGSLDHAIDKTRFLNLQYFATAKRDFLGNRLKATVRLGGANYDNASHILATRGTGFLDPNFNSMNNTTTTTQRSKMTSTTLRRVSAFGEITLGWQDYLFYTYSGRNDWTSTLPIENASFYYDAHTLSFVFSDLLDKKVGDWFSYGKLRFALAKTGKDAPVYRVKPGYEPQTTTGGGFSYGFTGPNPNLVPEFISSFEVGTELAFFKNRMNVDFAYYKKTSKDQILNNLRASYGTGFILATMNGGELWNKGIEVTVSGIPVATQNFRWNTSVNYTKINSKLVQLSDQIPEFYDSDTWLFGNTRNGVRLNGPLTTFTGQSFQRNAAGDILISPSTGLPLTETAWKIVGDRQPDFMMGFSNSFTYKDLTISFLFDIRKGGDVFNATEAFLFRNGLSKKTLDRENPRVFEGVLKDGLENTATPTRNNIQINPYLNNNFYLSTSIPDEQFIEQDIDWLRLRDLTISYNLSKKLLSRQNIVKTARIFATGTDLFMITNYSGGDPGVNGTSPAQGGSGGSGFDYGNLPLPRVFNFGLTVTF